MRLATLLPIAAIAALASPSSLADDFETSATLIGESWQLLDGGVETGNETGAYLDLNLDGSFDEGRINWHSTILGYAGNRAVDTFTGDFGVYSNLITDSEWILFTAWLELPVGDTEAKLRLGQLASDETFYGSDTAGHFLNSNFGALPTVSANIAAPIYSVGAAGLEISAPLGNGYAAFGTYAGDPGPGDADDHGFNWRAGGSAGYTFIGEVGLTYSSRNDGEGVLKLGAYLTTAEVDRFDASDAAASRNHAFYAVIDQPLASVGNGDLNGFARYGYNPLSDRSTVEHYLDLGATLSSFLDTRPNDVLGIAYSNTSFSNDYLNAQSSSGTRVNGREQVVEISYLASLGEKWSIQCSAQWISPPHLAEDDAFLFGLRIVSEL